MTPSDSPFIYLRNSGKGLGKKEDGIAKAISVEKKKDTAGVCTIPSFWLIDCSWMVHIDRYQ